MYHIDFYDFFHFSKDVYGKLTGKICEYSRK